MVEQHDISEVGQADGESEVELVEVKGNSDRNEIKVVIFLKDGKGYMGIQAPECDPMLTPLEGDLGAALERVPELVQQAQDKWAENARYPKADVPKPPVPERQATPSRQPVKPKTAQPLMF